MRVVRFIPLFAKNLFELLADQGAMPIKRFQQRVIIRKIHGQRDDSLIFRLFRQFLRLLVIQILEAMFQIAQKNVSRIQTGDREGG